MKFKEFILKVKDKVLDMIFPSDIKCIFCGKDIPDENIHYCEVCGNEKIFNDGNKCIKCDTKIKKGNIICDNCKDYTRPFEKAICPLNYIGNVRKTIIQFKSDNAKYLTKPLTKFIYDKILQEKIEFDIIVPVPSHKQTIKKRGYNPACLLAYELSSLTSKPVEEVLVKNVLTPKQKDLTFLERQTNLENSMCLTDKNLIKGKTILIIDDIITTCATVNACANLLYGANKIYACAIARRHLS